MSQSPEQSNKVDYLYKQNRKLRQENEDLREVIKMNKVQIDVLSKNNTHNKYIDVIANHRQAMENQHKRIENLQTFIEQLNSEKFMLEQLHNEATGQLKALQQLHKDRVSSLQSVILNLQEKIVFLEKSQKNYDLITGFVQKNKQIFNPTQQALQFKQLQDQTEQEVHLMKLQIQQGRQNEDNLMKVNGILRHKVVALQAKLAMPSRNLGQILDKSLKRLMMYFIETQKRLLTGQESDSEGQQDLQLIAPQLSTFYGQQRMRRQKDFGVPHINLLYIRGTLQAGNIKIKEQLIKRNHLSLQQKLQRLQIELQYTRRELTKNLIDLREETDRRKTLQKICDQLQVRNEMLCLSNSKMEKRYQKYMKQAKGGKSTRFDNDQTLNDISITLRWDNNIGDKKKEVQKIKNTQICDSPEQYKIHLQLLAKQLLKNDKMQKLSQLKKKQTKQDQEWKPQLKRSTSNPFLYFNQRRADIMQVHKELPKGRQAMRFQQTAIFNHNHISAQQDLDDVQV